MLYSWDVEETRSNSSLLLGYEHIPDNLELAKDAQDDRHQDST